MTTKHFAMQTFKVLIHGRGLVVRRWWIFRRHLGFYVTCFVAANDAEEAQERALESVRGEPRLALAALRAPTLAAEEVTAVEGSVATWTRQGIIFYPAGVDSSPTGQSSNVG